MPLSILSNVSSLRSQRALSDSTRRVGLSFERLSSGLRINRASDDAAGLAISEDLRVESRITATASRNVSDGVSLLQIAGGALDSISSLLTRMSELAEQAANGTLGSEQRAALDQEYNSLSREIARISESTEFNGIKLFGGEQVTGSKTASSQLETVLGISADGKTVFGKNNLFPPNLHSFDTETGEVTLEIAGADYDPSGIGKVAVDASGNRVVFEAGDEIFLYDRTIGQVTQLTDAASVGTTEAYYGLTISADGNTVAFTSQARYDSAGNASGNGADQIVTIDLSTGVYGSIVGDFTTTPAHFELSANGDYLVTTSRDNFNGNNPDVGADVFVADIRSGSGSLENITNGANTDSASSGGITNDGRVFLSSSSNLGGLNPGGDNVLFEYDQGSGEFEAKLSLPTGQNFASLTLSADGQTLHFLSAGDFAGDNPNNQRQLFRYDADLDQVTQITALTTSTFINASLISADGSLVTDNAGTFNFNYFDTTMSAANISIDTGDGSIGVIQTELGALRASLDGFSGYVISSEFAAKQTLDVLEENRGQLASIQGSIGAGLSRLETAHSVLGQKKLEFDSARSRIVDVDVADEAAQLTRNTILQQAGAAVLTQANAQTDLALLLLESS